MEVGWNKNSCDDAVGVYMSSGVSVMGLVRNIGRFVAMIVGILYRRGKGGKNLLQAGESNNSLLSCCSRRNLERRHAPRTP